VSQPIRVDKPYPTPATNATASGVFEVMNSFAVGSSRP
jgi:hypothetical protein